MPPPVQPGTQSVSMGSRSQWTTPPRWTLLPELMASGSPTARRDGVGVAAAHACSMATAAGESINGVCSITDSTTNYPITNSLDQGSAGMAAGGATASGPVQPGAKQSTAQVTVVYALDPSTTSHKG